MDLLAAFLIFMAAMIAALVSGITMIWALIVGLAAFIAAGMHRGFGIGELCKMSFHGAKGALPVIRVLVVIGAVTAAWRISGTITIFVYYGIRLITPSLFLIIAYLLACLLSYALGTSFGVAGTVGVIFMTLARSGNVDPVIAAGVLLSGVYFGDRCSPVSSCANMIAGITDTDIFSNVKLMLRTGLIPFIICIILYSVLSFSNPISNVDAGLVHEFRTAFVLSPWAFVPAIIMLVLPLFRVSIMTSMGLSIASSAVIACTVQGASLTRFAAALIFGYDTGAAGLGKILNGGGIVSMLEVIGILLLSCAYSGIFSGTDMLRSLQSRLAAAAEAHGRFPVMVGLGIVSTLIFCNQTIDVILCCDLLREPYLKSGASKTELAIDMENSVVTFAGCVPWCIGCSVPLSFMGADYRSVPFAFFTYLIPLFYLFAKKHYRM